MKKGMKILLTLVMAIVLTVIGGANVKAEDVTLTSGKWTNGTFTSTATEQYYKINVKKTGYIKIEMSRTCEDADTLFSICDSKKKVVVKASGDSISYVAVKKGTYYVLVNDVAQFDEMDESGATTENYQIKYTFKKMNAGKKITTDPFKYKTKTVTVAGEKVDVKTIVGFKKTPKATTLKKNKEVSGLVFHNGKSGSLLYKFVVPKTGKVKFTYEIQGAGTLLSENWCSPSLDIVDAKANVLQFDEKGNETDDAEEAVMWEGKGTDTLKLKKGTYYFVISAEKGDTGFYKLKLK